MAEIISDCALPFLPRGDGQHRDPRGAQHPDDGGPGLHRHQLGCHPRVSRLPGPSPLPTLESFPAGLVCCSRSDLLSAHHCGGAQLRPAGTPGGVTKGGVTGTDWRVTGQRRESRRQYGLVVERSVRVMSSDPCGIPKMKHKAAMAEREANCLQLQMKIEEFRGFVPKKINVASYSSKFSNKSS